jgi:FkbH-like protein|tara:strand:- start:331 stop:2037 length:1707 start_codon:yes stop_codon:yes gene_type:complete
MLTYDKVLKYNSIKKNNFKKILINFLSNFNNDILKDYVDYFSRKMSNIKTEFKNNEFDQIEKEILLEEYNKENYEYLIIGYDVNSKLNFDENLIKNYIKNIKDILNHIRNSKKLNNSNVIFFNLSQTQSIDYYSNEEKNKFINQILTFNKYLDNVALRDKNISVLNIDQIINRIGRDNYYDDKNFFLFKSPYSELAHNIIGQEISKIISSTINIKKKCLVLDLDNTIWGGVLGDVGPHGIDLTSFVGKNFIKFQKYIRILKKEGIILAACSKNNFEDVKECFNKNKNMILRLSDFSSIKANWSPKFENINIIAKELNIGKDSIVFFDDSDFEKSQMINFNKTINVIETSKDPKNFIRDIEDSNYFKIKNLTTEDKKKNYQYKILKRADTLKKKSKNINEFYKGLNMILEISSINKYNFERSVQIINKTNQFNLTTKRYNEIDLKKFLDQKNQFSYVARLKDKFGDHGITALIMINKLKNKWFIDNFILSCRILSRNIEKVFLNEILQKLFIKKISSINGIYKKTNKNSQCKNFYLDNGFIKLKENHFLSPKKFRIKGQKLVKVKYVKN